MRIATRLWIALLFTIVAVLGVGVITRVREEQRLLLEVTLRDRRFFALVLQEALAHQRGEAEALAATRALLEHDEISDAHISARIVHMEGDGSHPGDRLRTLLPPKKLATLAHNEPVVAVYAGELVTYVPLHAGVALELVEPHAVDSLLARIGWRSLWTQALSLAALAGVVTLVLTRWLVGRPLEELATLARQIGAGDFSVRATRVRGKHEAAILGREMNGMAEELERARRTVDDLSAERVAALEQLRHADRLRTVGQLASTLAHELGTPLNVVSGHARSIEQEQEVHPGSEVHASARAILEQSRRMTGILKDLLGFARRRGRKNEPVDLVRSSEHAARMLEPLARRRGVHIECSVKSPVERVHADAQQLMQVLTNLLTNAIQAMPSGGRIEVAVDEVDATPPIGVHGPSGRYARIAVRDHGVGIDGDDLPRLFEPFFTRKSEDEGTGLGLAVVEGIMRDHRGFIDVQSVRGEGSCFSVYLPITPAVPSGVA
jgi:two-component system, NtrC family, sensor kinase